MSLLLANGHPDARRYPIGRVFEEAGFVMRREERSAAALATLIQMGVSTLPNMAAKPQSVRLAGERWTQLMRKIFGG